MWKDSNRLRIVLPERISGKRCVLNHLAGMTWYCTIGKLDGKVVVIVLK